MQPDLVVFSDGLAYPPIELIELCIAKNIRFVTIAQANSDCFWLDDMDAKRYRVGFAAALRCYFVQGRTSGWSRSKLAVRCPTRNWFGTHTISTKNFRLLGLLRVKKVSCASHLLLGYIRLRKVRIYC